MKTAENYYLDENYNCAEATLHLANEKYDLGLTEEEMRLVSGFGAGMCCGITCGVLSACMAALSRELIKTKAHETENFKELFGNFAKRFAGELGSYNCSDIKVKNFHPDCGRCILTVKTGEALLDAYRREIGLQ